MTDLKKSILRLYDENNANPFLLTHNSSGTELQSNAGNNITMKSILSVDDGTNAVIPSLGAEIATIKSTATSEVASINASISNLTTNLASEIVRATASESANSTNISAETTARASADTTLQSNLDTVETDLTTALAAETSARTTAVVALALTSSNGDSALQTNIDNEETARLAADASLQSQITNILSNTDPSALDSLSEIVQAFQSADGTLTGLINALTTRVTNLETEVANHLSQ